MSRVQARGTTSRRGGIATLAVSFAAGLFPAAGWAQNVDVTSTTLLHARPEYRAGTSELTMPVVEIFGLRASGIDAGAIQDLKVLVSAWGELAALGVTDQGGRIGADVDLALVEARVFDRFRLRLGRQLVLGGTARIMPLDGGSLEIGLPGNLSLTAWGGVPVTPRFAYEQGDAATGGRLSWRPSFETEFGASYTFVIDEGLRAREEAGLDARWTIVAPLTLTGSAIWSLAANRLAEFDLGPRWRALPNLELGLAVRRTAPDLFLPRNSVLSVFTENERDEILASLWWRATDRFTLSADVRGLSLAARDVDPEENDPVWQRPELDASTGTDSGVTASLRVGARARTLLIGTVRVLRLSDSGYVRGRAAIQHTFPNHLALALDAEAVSLDPRVNDYGQSLSAAASINYPFAEEWAATVHVAGGSDPIWTDRFEVMAKLTYRMNSRMRSRGDR